MTTTTIDMQVWVGCLACYNGGALVGEWIAGYSAGALTTEALHERHEHPAMAPGEVHEELWCFDLEGYAGFVAGECSPMEAQRIAEAVEDMDDDTREAFGAWIGDGSGDIDDRSTFEDQFCGVWDSFRDYAENLAEDIGAMDADVRWPYTHINWDHAAAELAMDYGYADVSGGRVAVWHL